MQPTRCTCERTNLQQPYQIPFPRMWIRHQSAHLGHFLANVEVHFWPPSSSWASGVCHCAYNYAIIKNSNVHSISWTIGIKHDFLITTPFGFLIYKLLKWYIHFYLVFLFYLCMSLVNRLSFTTIYIMRLFNHYLTQS